MEHARAGVGANILDASGRTIGAARREPVIETLSGALEPLGQSARAERWLEWTAAAARSAA